MGRALCLAAQARDWQSLEHHLASFRLGINSALQVQQIDMRLVTAFRRGLGSAIERSFTMR
jgi:hypothetical protein